MSHFFQAMTDPTPPSFLPSFLFFFFFTLSTSSWHLPVWTSLCSPLQTSLKKLFCPPSYKCQKSTQGPPTQLQNVANSNSAFTKVQRSLNKCSIKNKKSLATKFTTLLNHISNYQHLHMLSFGSRGTETLYSSRLSL